jgi:hypothetical protein
MDEPSLGHVGLVAERADPDTTWRPWVWRRQPKWSYAPKGSGHSPRMRAFGAVGPRRTLTSIRTTARHRHESLIVAAIGGPVVECALTASLGKGNQCRSQPPLVR